MKYQTIVVDPPWDHSDGTGLNWGVRFAPRAPVIGRPFGTGYGDTVATGVPYQTMTVAEISALPVGDLARLDAHLYLWTTSRYLHESFHVIEAWGFKAPMTLVWCKNPKGFMGGAWRSSVEFIQFARRGSLPHLSQAPSRWFNWPRTSHSTGAGQATSAGHSAKPEAFLDLVEQVSPGPYLELFARRQRLGWDTWGDEALNHVELTA